MKTRKLFIVLFVFSLIVSMVTDVNRSSAKIKKTCYGEVMISAYCPETNDPVWSRETSTGKVATAEHTVAVDMHDPFFSYGVKVMFEGDDTIYTVEDCGNLNHYGRDFDMFFDTKSEVLDWGVRCKKVYLITEVPDEDADKKAKRHTVNKKSKAIHSKSNKNIVLPSIKDNMPIISILFTNIAAKQFKPFELLQFKD